MAISALRSVELELPAVPQSVPRARHAVLRMLAGLELDLWPVGIVVSEAVTNVVLHAYRDGTSGRVSVQASLEATVLTLVVADDGVGMMPNPDSPGLGMGLALIRDLADHLDLQRADGTTTLIARLQLVAAA